MARENRKPKTHAHRRRAFFEPLEPRLLLAANWQNPVVSLDVNRDHSVSPIDALIPINYLNDNGSQPVTIPLADDAPYLDVNGDNNVSPIDVLQVVNAIIENFQLPIVLNDPGTVSSEQSIVIGLGQDAGARNYRFEIDATFDTSDLSSSLEDIFVVYLVDNSAPTTTLLDRGVNGTSLFSLAGDQADFISGLVRFDGSIVEIDLTSLGDLEGARLVFQLLGSDSDSGTQVIVRPVDNEVDPEGVQAPTFMPMRLRSTAGSPLDFSTLELNTELEPIVSNVRYDRTNGEYRADLQVRNNGEAIGRKIAVELTGLAEGVSLRNASGDAPSGNPYISFRNAIGAGGLANGKTSDAIEVVLDITNQTPFSWSLDVLSGGENQAPVFASIAPITIMPGDSADIALSATDPDGDPVTFSFTPADSMPTMMFNGNGSMRLAPTRSDIGSYSFKVRASDGSLSNAQTVEVNVVEDPIATTRISGVVLDTEGAPLEGVPVEVGRFQAVTSADGTFQIELPSFTVPTEEFDILVPIGDVQFDPLSEGDKTISLDRAGFDTSTGTSTGNPRRHPNLVSSFLDASVVYGSNDARGAALRLNDGTGKLKTSTGNLLPLNDGTFFPSGPLENENQSQNDPTSLFAAGDVRANENPALTSLHTLFVREHNRRAEELALADSSLTGEQLYQEARRWVSAILQHITYDEFLPLLLGEGALPAYGGYDDSKDPSISVLFSGAAFRYGHSISRADLALLDATGNSLPNSPISLRDAFFNPSPIQDHGIEPVLRGMSEQLIEALDAQVIDNLRNFLFGPPGSGGSDLVSLNIQRGRDLGLPSYNDTRRELGLTPVTSFADITDDASVQSKLSDVYADVELVDLWVGGLAESHQTGAVVGETFWTIIRDQFQRTRDGDRFWYENSQFTDAELTAIRSISLSDLIVQNTSIAALPASVFTTQTVPAPFGSGGSSTATAPTEYRSLDGGDNSLSNPSLGQSLTNLLVSFAPGYADGISAPAGGDRPTAREISNSVFSQSESTAATQSLTNMFTIWGQFLTHDTNLTPGGTDDTLRIHGDMASSSNAYPFVAEKLPLMLEHPVLVGANNVIARPIFLPALDVAGGTVIDPTQDTMVMQEIAPGDMAMLEVTAGTLQNRQGEMFDGVLSITEVPSARTPAALPSNLLPDTVVTIQPGDMVFTQPAPLTLPNRAGFAPGTKMDLWSINPDTGEFDDVGDAVVSVDGLVIETVTGGVRNSSWHMATPQPMPAQVAAEKTPLQKTCGCGSESQSGLTSEVELHSGALRERHTLVSYQSLGATRALTLYYNSERADSRPIVPFGFDNVQDQPGTKFAASLSFRRGSFVQQLPGFSGGGLTDGGFHFWQIPTGGGDIEAALQGDLRDQPTGIYNFTIRQGILNENDGQFNGTLSETSGQITHINEVNSAFGAGWQLSGLQQLVENPDGSILFIESSGADFVFQPPPTVDGPFVSPAGDFSTLVKNTDGSFTRTTTDQTVFQFDRQGRLTTTTDRNGNQTVNVYEGGKLTKIVDPVGLETSFTYTGDRVTEITDPASRITTLEYDAAGNLSSITDPDGSRRTFEFDADYLLTGEVDQVGNREEAFYGFHGRVVGATRKDGTFLQVDPLQTRFLHPATVTSNPATAPVANLVASDQGISNTVDANGNVVRTILDQQGQAISSSDAEGRLGTVRRNSDNLVVSETDGRGFTTYFTYDQRGNVLSIERPGERSGLQSGPLFPGPEFVVGDSPAPFAAGDFNGDGAVDLVTANRTSDDLSVLLGNGNATFQSEQRFSVSLRPTSVATADFNGDGFSDLVAANAFDTFVSVLLGNGDGSFKDEQQFRVGTFPASVAVGDFNRDGAADLVTVSTSSNDASVLLGNGDGTFQDDVRFSVGEDPSFVSAQDLNGDGNLDLIAANSSSNDVSTLLGNGDGTFQASQSFSVGDNPIAVIVGDFTGDNILDLGTANQDSDDVSVLTGIGDGTFGAEQRFAVGDRPRSLNPGDFNGDGQTDLVVANGGDNSLSVLLGDQDSLFQGDQQFSVDSFLVAATAADFNGDGVTDVVTGHAGFGPDKLLVALGKGDGTLQTETLQFAVGRRPESLAVQDVTGDGVPDIVTANESSDDVSVLPGIGDGRFLDEQRIAVGDQPNSVIADDLNGDGIADLVTANGRDDNLSILWGSGGGTFPDVLPLSEAGTLPVSVSVSDLNGDGDADLLIANQSSDDLSVLLGNGDGSFQAEQRIAAGDSPGFVVADNFNDDGFVDLVATNTDSDDVSVRLGNGDGTFQAEQRISVGDGPRLVTVADLDGDGHNDLVVVNGMSNDVSVLRGIGDGTFEAEQRFATGTAPVSVVIGDLDQNGVVDLITANQDSNDVSVLLGNGDGTFQTHQAFNVGLRPVSVSVADFDGNGVVDLATANSTDVSVLLGNGDGTFQSEQRVGLPRTPGSLVTGDFNNDGDADLAVVYINSDEMSVLMGNGDGSFSVNQQFFVGGQPGTNSVGGFKFVATGDFDNDGSADLVAVNSNANGAVVIMGRGDGTFHARQHVPVGRSPSFVLVADFNGDGLSDLSTSNSSSSDVSVILRSENGSFMAEQRFSANGIPDFMAAGDFNGDNVTDLATANGFSDGVSILLGNGDGTFQPEQRLLAGEGVVTLALGDFDGNGTTDLVTANQTSNDLSLILGNGNGTFQAEQRIFPGIDHEFVIASDVNQDGVTDLISITHGLAVMLGNGDGSFQEPQSFNAESPRFVSTGDINRDGVTDLVTTFNGGQFGTDGMVQVVLGNGSAPLNTFTYESTFNQLTSSTDELGRATLYEIDPITGNTLSERRVVGEVDSLANGETDDVVTTFTYTSNGLVDTVTDPLGRVTDFDYNTSGLVSQITIAVSTGDEAVQQLIYDAAGNRTATIDANGNRTEFVYDLNNRLTEIAEPDPDGTGPQSSPVTTFGYDARGNLLETTDALDSRAIAEFDARDRVRLTRDAQGNETTFTYDPNGNLVSSTDARGNTTRFTYDRRDRRIETMTPDGGVTKFDYDFDNNLIRRTDPNGNETRFEYDSRGRLASEIDPFGEATRFGYDGVDNLVRQTDRNGQVSEFVYDELNRPVEESQLDAVDGTVNTTTRIYDRASNLLSTTDPNDNVVRFTYDSKNRRVETIDADGGTTTLRYDANDNLIQLKDPLGNETDYTYDALDRLVIEVDPFGEQKQYIYDAVGNTIRQTDRNGRVTEFTYDTLHRISTETWLNPDASSANLIEFSYDANSNLLSVSDDVSTLTFAYDNRDRVESVDNADTLPGSGLPNVILEYSYDLIGNVLSVSEATKGSSGVVTTYEYDALNRMTSVQQNGSGVQDKLVDLVYNRLGQFEEILRFSDLSRENTVANSSYQYDGLNRLTDLNHVDSVDAALAFYDFEYDGANRITALTDINGRTDFGYDDRDQLTGATRSALDTRPDETYVFDANGNRTNSSRNNDGYVTGNGNRLESDGTFNYEYDAEGNMILKTDIAAGEFREFEYDHRNRLIRVTDFSSGSVATQEVSYTYDALDRRIAKTVDADGAGSGGEETTHFVYDRDNVLLDFVDADGTGTATQPELVARYLFGPGVDQVIAREEVTGGQTQWMLGDHLGTIHDIIDDDGAILNHILYDSFGNVLDQSDALVTTRYLFTGRELDAETGLYYYRARFYDANIGRFLSEDPIGFEAGDANVYRYVINLPNHYTDPTGEIVPLLAAAAGYFIVGGVTSGGVTALSGGTKKEIAKSVLQGGAISIVAGPAGNAAKVGATTAKLGKKGQIIAQATTESLTGATLNQGVDVVLRGEEFSGKEFIADTLIGLPGSAARSTTLVHGKDLPFVELGANTFGFPVDVLSGAIGNEVFSTDQNTGPSGPQSLAPRPVRKGSSCTRGSSPYFGNDFGDKNLPFSKSRFG